MLYGRLHGFARNKINDIFGLDEFPLNINGYETRDDWMTLMKPGNQMLVNSAFGSN